MRTKMYALVSIPPHPADERSTHASSAAPVTGRDLAYICMKPSATAAEFCGCTPRMSPGSYLRM